MIKRYRLPTRILDDDKFRRRGPKYLPSRQRGALPGLEGAYRWRWIWVDENEGVLEADVTPEQHELLIAQVDVIEV